MVKQITEHKKYLLRGFFQLCVDMLVVGSGFLIAHQVYAGLSAISATHVYAAVTTALVFGLIASAFGVYKPIQLNMRLLGFGTLATAWVTTASVMLLFAYITKTSSIFSRVAVGGALLGIPLALIGARLVLAFLFSFLQGAVKPRAVALAGYSENARRFIDKLSSSADIGIKLTGLYLSSEASLGLSEGNKSLVKGNLEKLVDDVKQGLYDEVYIALEMSEEEGISDLISELSDCSIPVFFIPGIFTMNLLTSQLYHFEGMPIVSVYDSPMDARDLAIKRMEDIVLSFLILLIIALPMLVIAIAIKLTSSGPVVFKQKRYGLAGKPIVVWKFRSMTVCDDGNMIVQARKNDARLTSVGAFLRKTSLDELPQFINVLVGDMSIVGPRPHAVAHNELYRKDIKRYMLRHLTKPGITGWAQMNGWRGETDTLEKMEKRVQYDLEYIKNWSLWFDLKIIALTILKGFWGKSVY